jgi:hypothetical protein
MTPPVETFSGRSITKHCTEEIDPPLNASFLNFTTRPPAPTAPALLAWELGARAVNDHSEETNGQQSSGKNYRAKI